MIALDGQTNTLGSERYSGMSCVVFGMVMMPVVVPTHWCIPVGNFSPFDSLAYILNTNPNCFRLLAQLARRAASRARAKAGRRMAARIPMMAMTTNNSISVKPLLLMILRSVS